MGYAVLQGNVSISIHSLTRRLTVSQTIQAVLIHHFNSQPHKEADGNRLCIPSIYPCISIHSLTRRLTTPTFLLRACVIISIHSLTRRLTRDITSYPRYLIFQFTASQGGWLTVSEIHFLCYKFQFTASQGGWLRRKRCNGTDARYFNSQPHKEADVGVAIQNNKPAKFQFTASQGGWLDSFSITCLM